MGADMLAAAAAVAHQQFTSNDNLLLSTELPCGCYRLLLILDHQQPAIAPGPLSIEEQVMA
jgi:hypothetical protein